MRADQLLVERGLAASRSQGQRLIAAGLRWRLVPGSWKTVAKNGEEIPDAAELELVDPAEARYVSRGGIKLEGALRASGLSPAGWRCLDVGQSTGGFTDVLLQQGAAAVLGVDVGHGQLNPRLRQDARVVGIEGFNARAIDAARLLDAGAPADWMRAGFDLIVGDLSFISLTLVLSKLPALLAPGGQLLMLVKPQFELQPEQIGKGGLVKDPALYGLVEQRIREACQAVGLQVRGWFDSVIAGGDGNREFFIWACQA